MNLRENIRLALSSLLANKMRALLTMLGIIIGIGAVIGIVTVGDSLTYAFTSTMADMGVGNIIVGLQQKENELTQITGILIPGDDTETDGELRQRLITALNERPFGGNIAAYREYVLGLDGVGAVQVYPTWDGGGTVKLSILGADLLPASEELVETVQNAVDPPPGQGLGLGMAPIGAQVTVAAPSEVAVAVTATLTLAAGYQIGQVQGPVETAIGAYLETVRQSWATNVSSNNVEYEADVYLARITAAIVGVAGVVNATGVQLNGGTADLTLTQTGASQQVPILGTVTLSE